MNSHVIFDNQFEIVVCFVQLSIDWTGISRNVKSTDIFSSGCPNLKSQILACEERKQRRKIMLSTTHRSKQNRILPIPSVKSVLIFRIEQGSLLSIFSQSSSTDGYRPRVTTTNDSKIVMMKMRYLHSRLSKLKRAAEPAH